MEGRTSSISTLTLSVLTSVRWLLKRTLDVLRLSRPTLENAEAIMGALNAFGFASLGLNYEDLLQVDPRVPVGRPGFSGFPLFKIQALTPCVLD